MARGEVRTRVRERSSLTANLHHADHHIPAQDNAAHDFLDALARAPPERYSLENSGVPGDGEIVEDVGAPLARGARLQSRVSRTGNASPLRRLFRCHSA